MLENLSAMLLSVTPKILASCSKLCSRPGIMLKDAGKFWRKLKKHHLNVLLLNNNNFFETRMSSSQGFEETREQEYLILGLGLF